MSLVARAQALAAAGHDVIHLGVGEPDFPTPAPVIEAGQRALADGQTRYTPAAGMASLREAIAGFYASRFGVHVPAECVVVTPGASGALQLLLASLVDPGDEVLVTDPGYPCNRHFVELVNGVPRPLLLDPANGWALTPEQIAAAWNSRTRAALLASPDNPTGNVMTPSQVGALADVVRERGGALIMDEIYQGLVYDAPAFTALSVAPDTLVINSFSKYFGMTGWRLGWLVAPRSRVPDLERMAQNFFLAPSTLAQHAALAAFSPDTLAELERRRQQLAERRALLLSRLPALGLHVVGEPAGAFYLYLDASALTDDSFGFCERLLEQAHVALTPGVDFGSGHNPAQYLRVAYTCDLARLDEALTRIVGFLERA
ncbi:aminotransferase class I/II-fold pyridoxal phosphate-dependent enzyme [Alcanivorax sp. JB21]|uniref:aminotransferase class I/II-fold pyridoxal phosphate-dependent enzyme n=1 Tax=Alcanivorax limicola TaxID=2874102 RepID=UPI001CBC6C87|nr:aminotransferase class I/II-fold pyridoxal phosphate-dependent enzyme [Alcanivorax limicola]MBZ2189438.1 aminotransferase class I/II-fold pyridoxal phosphate-dependent enzyme [Alcanivorax limicola]